MAEPLLVVDDVHGYYGTAHVLEGVSFSMSAEPVALIGRNGMGKSTLCAALVGLLGSATGSVRLEGVELLGRPAYKIASAGIGFVPQGRRLFQSLTVDEHLEIVGAKSSAAWTPQRVYELFPRLGERKQVSGTSLSGGEQQMLAIGRALMSKPRMLMLDEPSLGLGPLLVAEIFEIIERLNRELETTILVVEQNARLALGIADHGYIMENGRIVLDEPADELRRNPDVQEFYLGLSESGERRSYRDVKHYKRRKRWL